jgi:hypothetical protein
MGTSDVIGAASWSDHDSYTDEALLDPWLGYQQLRDAGPAVWLPKYEVFALTRYDSYPGQANSTFHHPGRRAAPQQCSPRLQDITGRQQLTWWTRHMPISLNPFAAHGAGSLAATPITKGAHQ